MKFTVFIWLFMSAIPFGISNLVLPKVIHILREFFPTCEIIFVSNQEYNGTESTTTLSPLPFQYSQSAGNFIVQNTMDQVVTFQRLKDVHKFLPIQCGVGLLYVGKISPSLPQWLFETMTPRYVPIIRKDVDHFIFLFNSEEHADNILTSYGFGQKIKLKLGIVYRGKVEQSLYKTVNLYENGGGPKVKSLDIDTAIQDLHSLFPDTTGNMHGKLLRVAKVKPNQYFEMERLPDGTNRALRGFYKVWLDEMMEHFNFTILLKLSSLNGGTGKLFPNGTWAGAVGDILYDNADLAVFVGHIYNRHPFVDWSAPLSYEWMLIVNHKPRTFFSPSAIIKPFPAILWLGFLLSVLLICYTLRIISIFFPLGFSYKTSLVYLLSTFLEQDAANYMSILSIGSVRVIVSFWLLFALVLSTAYRGKLVSLIAFPATTWVPETMDDLAYSNYRVGVNVLGKGGASYTIFSTSEHPVYKRIFEKMETYYDASECLKQGLTQEIGCIMWISIAGYNVYRNFTDKFGRTPFQSSLHTTSFVEDGYVWEKRAVFSQRFNRVTWSILERGLATFWTISDFNNEKKKSLDWQSLHQKSSVIHMDNDGGPSKLQLVHLTGLLYLFLVGLLFSLLALFGEVYRKKVGREKIRKLWRKKDTKDFVDMEAHSKRPSRKNN